MSLKDEHPTVQPLFKILHLTVSQEISVTKQKKLTPSEIGLQNRNDGPVQSLKF